MAAIKAPLNALVCLGSGPVMPRRCNIAQRLLSVPLIILSLLSSDHRAFAAAVANCDSETLATAVAAGGMAAFQCDGTIILTNTIVVTKAVILDGTGRSVTLSGNGAGRLFHILPSGDLTLINLTLSDGRSTNGGAIYNQGVVNAIACLISNNNAVGFSGVSGTNGPDGNNWIGGNGTPGLRGSDASGGAICNLGTLRLTNCTLVANSSTGGRGGDGGSGGNGHDAFDPFGRCRGYSGGNGAIGGIGGAGLGGAIFNSADATLVSCTLRGNQAIGGTGGAGGNAGKSGCFAYSGQPGFGGAGGEARGGSIYNGSRLELIASAGYSNIVKGGAGGTGGNTTNEIGYAIGGTGGPARGGLLYNAGSNTLLNCTIALNSSLGGDPGRSGIYRNAGSVQLCPGYWYTGNASGGAIENAGFLAGSHCTIWENRAFAGPNTILDTNCGVYITSAGQVAGVSIACPTGRVELLNSIVGGSIRSNQISGVLLDLGANICFDGSCQFTNSSSRSWTDPLLGPLADNGGPTLTLGLHPESPAIDLGLSSTCPLTDQRGYERPSGAGCDSGVVETFTFQLPMVQWPMVRQSAFPSTIRVGDRAELTIVIQNPNNFPLTGVRIETDLRPFLVAQPVTTTNQCGASVEALPFSDQLRIFDLVLGSKAACTVRVDVTSWVATAVTNTLVSVASLETGGGIRFPRLPLVSTAPEGSRSALAFNGLNQALHVTTPLVGPLEFTLSLWFKTAAPSRGGLIGFNDSLGDPATWDRHLFLDADGRMIFEVYPNPAIASVNAFTDGRWHHVTATLSRATGMKLFIDGYLVASNPAGTNAVPYVGYWKIGYVKAQGWPYPPNSYFEGEIDEVQIWNRSLSESEIRQRMTCPRVGNEDGLVLYWRFDEQIGDFAFDGSGHGISARLINAPAWINPTAPLLDIVPIRYVSPNQVRLQFLGVENGVYRLFVSPDLGTWFAGGDQIASPIGLLNFEDSVQPPDSKRFYRLVQLGPPPILPPFIVERGATQTVVRTTVPPHQYPSDVYFMYGTNSTLNHQTLPWHLETYEQHVAITQNLTELQPASLYTVKAVRSNEWGTSYSYPLSFFSTDAGMAIDFSRSGFAGSQAAITNSGTFTVGVWLKNTNRPAAIWSYGGDYRFYLNSVGQAQFGIYTNGGFRVIRSAASYADGLWHHFAATSSPNGAKLYVDGELVASDARPTSSLGYSGPVGLLDGLGGWPDTTTNLFVLPVGTIVGTIDELQLWTIDHTQSEIAATMNRRLRGDEPGLAAYWRFDEGPGGATADITGRGNRLLIYNSPRWVLSTVPLW